MHLVAGVDCHEDPLQQQLQPPVKRIKEAVNTFEAIESEESHLCERRTRHLNRHLATEPLSLKTRCGHVSFTQFHCFRMGFFGLRTRHRPFAAPREK